MIGLPLYARPVTLATLGLRARRPRFCALDNRKLVAVGAVIPHWESALSEFLQA